MTQKRVSFFKEFLSFIGLHPDRLQLTWVSSSEARQFAEAVNAFEKKIQEIGPSPLRRSWPLKSEFAEKVVEKV